MRRSLLGAALLVAWAAFAAPARAADDRAVKVRRAVVYRVAPGALHLDLFQPLAPGARRRPAMVWIHGGGFVAGGRSEMEGYATALAQRGWTTVSIDYRLATPSGLRHRGCGPVIADARRDAHVGGADSNRR